MDTPRQPFTGYSKPGTIANSGTHVWGRCSVDPRVWSVIPIDPREPVVRAVADDFGNLVPVQVLQ